jgi:hypothetical protein
MKVLLSLQPAAQKPDVYSAQCRPLPDETKRSTPNPSNSGRELPPPIGERQVKGSGVFGSVELEKYRGVVESTGSFNGQRFTIVFTDSAFRHREWKCVELGGGGSFSLGGWPKILVRRASAALVRTLTAIANAHHTIGFNTRQMRLEHVKVTNNGWAVGTPTAKNPRLQGNGVIVFRLVHGRWRVDTAGSAFPGSNIPGPVATALGI